MGEEKKEYLKSGGYVSKCESEEQPWYTESWYMEDLENALKDAGIEVTEENLKKMLLGCRGIFDDKTVRNEILEDKARELFREE